MPYLPRFFSISQPCRFSCCRWRERHVYNTAVQIRKAVTAYLKSEQLQPFGFETLSLQYPLSSQVMFAKALARRAMCAGSMLWPSVQPMVDRSVLLARCNKQIGWLRSMPLKSHPYLYADSQAFIESRPARFITRTSYGESQYGSHVYLHTTPSRCCIGVGPTS